MTDDLRPLLTIHVPMDLAAVSAVLLALAPYYPQATVTGLEDGDGQVLVPRGPVNVPTLEDDAVDLSDEGECACGVAVRYALPKLVGATLERRPMEPSPTMAGRWRPHVCLRLEADAEAGA